MALVSCFCVVPEGTHKTYVFFCKEETEKTSEVARPGFYYFRKYQIKIQWAYLSNGLGSNSFVLGFGSGKLCSPFGFESGHLGCEVVLDRPCSLELQTETRLGIFFLVAVTLVTFGCIPGLVTDLILSREVEKERGQGGPKPCNTWNNENRCIFFKGTIKVCGN